VLFGLPRLTALGSVAAGSAPPSRVASSPAGTPDPIQIDGSPGRLGYAARVTGTGSIPGGYQLWIMVRTGGGTRYWLSPTARAVADGDGHWVSPCVYFGSAAVDRGSHGAFTLYAVLVAEGDVDAVILNAPTYQEGYLASLPTSPPYATATWTRNDDVNGC
jgi:hypothetical protein